MPFVESSDDEAAAADGNNHHSGNANDTDEFDFCEGQTVVEDPDEDTLRILLSTDNHLGYEENDDVRGMDSFAAFEEVLYLAKRFKCDMVLLAGDLFHENRPSRRTLYKTMEILRRYTMGQDPVQVQILGDPNNINYLDPNISVDLPLFSIHGNHDDPTRDGGDLLAALDLLHVNLLVNYFGRQTEVNQVQISPILLQKGSTRVALYGLGSMREERLHRMWRDNKVCFLRPESKKKAATRSGEESMDADDDENEEDEDGFFNIFALHQNRDVGRGSKNCVSEGMLPEWLDVVVWGHEHECQIDFTESVLGTYRITQPGSSVATSLVAGEAVMKQVGVMDVRGKNFRLHKVPLTQIRPFVTNEVVLGQHKNGLDPEDNNIEKKVTKALEEEARLLILNAKEKQEKILRLAEEAGSNVTQVLARQGNKNPIFRHSPVHPEKVLVRIRVEHSKFTTLNNQRFGSRFVEEIANSDNILLFHRKKGAAEQGAAPKAGGAAAKQKKASSVIDIPIDTEMSESEQMYELVRGFLRKGNQNLRLLEERTMSEAMHEYVDKQSTQAIPDSTKSQLRKKQKQLIQKQDVSQTADIKKAVEESQSRPRVTDKSTMEDGDEVSQDEPSRSVDDSMDLDADDAGEPGPSSKKRKKAGSSKASSRKNSSRGLDDDDDEDMDEVSMLDNDDEEEEATSKRKRGATSRAASKNSTARGRRNMLDLDEEEEEVAPKKGRGGARSTSRRAATKKKVNYSVDNSDDDDGEEEEAFTSRRDDDESDDEVLVVEEPPKKKGSRARGTAAASSRKKKAPTASTATRKKRAGRSYMESDEEEDYRGAGGSSSAVLDEDWGSAATRSQI